MAKDGRTGRPRTPTNLAVLKGERDSRINHSEAQPDRALPIEPPDGVDLGDRGRAEWDRLIGDLKSKEVVTAWDVQALALWCDAVRRHWDAADLIDLEGLMLEETVYAKGEPIGERYKVHPAWKILQDTAAEMMRLSARFGFTPADRASIQIAPVAKTKPGEDLLTG